MSTLAFPWRFTLGTQGFDAGRTSRAFLPPHNLPPEEFAAYGIVAFPELPTPETEQRYVMACRAYYATLSESSSLQVPLSMQMVTVWPIVDEERATALRGVDDVSVCNDAVRYYHLETALMALRQAGKAGQRLEGQGPYLLAWAPSSQKGQREARVLVADLSTATTFNQFREYFRAWRHDIEMSPELWPDGWSIEGVRLAIRN